MCWHTVLGSVRPQMLVVGTPRVLHLGRGESHWEWFRQPRCCAAMEFSNPETANKGLLI